MNDICVFMYKEYGYIVILRKPVANLQVPAHYTSFRELLYFPVPLIRDNFP